VTEPFLYGVPGAERYYRTPRACFVIEIEPHHPVHNCGPATIEVWTAKTAWDFLPSTDQVIEYVTEVMEGNGFGSPDGQALREAEQDPANMIAFQQALDILADRLDYLMADQLVGTHTVTWDPDGEPLIDEAPLFPKEI
jgi:hypothetical protein